ncbi:MAG: DNA-binding response regulator [Gammaproteobacteria bacterium]|nr:MAG: DNA-binding response regulator [Gammaproteobacteria bacterium]
MRYPVPMRILIADDHPLYRDALQLLTRRLDHEAETVLAGDYDTLLRLSREDRWDLLLVDYHMPGNDPARNLARLCAEQAPTPVVVITSAEGGEEALAARQAGAMGYLPKAMDSQLILDALRLILAGGVAIHPAPPGGGGGTQSDPGQVLERLTDRQVEVLRHLCRGEPNKRIASQLGLSVSTVKQHIHVILRTMGAANRTEAVVLARSLFSPQERP